MIRGKQYFIDFGWKIKFEAKADGLMSESRS